MLFIRTIVFLFLIVATVVCYMPFLLVKLFPDEINLGAFSYSGIVLIAAGILFLLPAILIFLIKGKGTPAIYFSKWFKNLIGEEPETLISKGIYKFTRNPMYLGVILILTGESIFFQKIILFIYTLAMFIIFHLVIVHLEEPHLKKKHGQSFNEFMKKTKRWI